MLKLGCSEQFAKITTVDCPVTRENIRLRSNRLQQHVNKPVLSENEMFEVARSLPENEREAFLETACGNNSEVRERLEKLLLAYDGSEAFFDDASSEVNQHYCSLMEKPGDSVGRYRLLEKIGEGGCGVVYKAEQTEPVRRQVALKLIKVGMDTRAFISRFEAERQALALMDHSSIARVFDAGSTPKGRPYFVMELVNGMMITEYCDRHSLSLEDRLELFTQVCRAVQHAHQKGVIHRDLKPSNILVATDERPPAPKVIDFGIAKAVQGKLTDRTVFTACEQFLGTPAYISPEQALLKYVDIDTRADIYSLGVLLYELLVGRTPFDPKELSQAGFDEMRRIIREAEPPRPSARLITMSQAELTTIAQYRRTDPSQLIRTVRGDLDCIVMKTLEKDRTRRYEAASALGADVLRYLKDEPVLAVRPSASYRFRQFVRRNKLALGSAALVVASLVIGSVVSLGLYFKAKSAEATARSAAAQAISAANEASYLAQIERQNRLIVLSSYIDKLFEKPSDRAPFGRKPLLLNRIDGNRPLLSVHFDGADTNIMVVDYSEGLAYLLDNLSKAISLESKRKGSLDKYVSQCAESNEIPDIERIDMAILRSQDFKNEWFTDFNSLAGTVINLAIEQSANGTSKPAKTTPLQPNGSVGDVPGSLLYTAILHALEDRIVPVAFLEVIGSLAKSNKRVWWSEVFVPPGWKARDMTRVIVKAQIEFFKR